MVIEGATKVTSFRVWFSCVGVQRGYINVRVTDLEVETTGDRQSMAVALVITTYCRPVVDGVTALDEHAVFSKGYIQ